MNYEQLNKLHMEAGVNRVYYVDRDPELADEFGELCHTLHCVKLILQGKIDQLPTTSDEVL